MKTFEDITRIKDVIFETTLTVVLMSIGVNLLVIAISSIYKNTIAYLLIGLILILVTLVLIFYKNLYKSNRHIEIDGVVTYDEKNKCLVNIRNYKFMEDLCRYMLAAISEDSDIKSTWEKDNLGILNYDEIGNNDIFEPELSTSSIMLNQLIEYVLLEELNLATSDYFDSVKCKKDKICKIERSDIGDLLIKNSFIARFSKPISQRCVFSNIEEDDDLVSLFENGAIYNKFELNLPINCKIKKDNAAIIINHPYFVLKIEYDFDGMNATLPNMFEQKYMNIVNNKNLNCYSVPIIIDLKFRTCAILMHKTKYYEWIDEYINALIENISFSAFLKRIQWELASTIISCL